MCVYIKKTYSMATVTIPAFVSVELSYQVTKGYNFGLQFSINLGINYNGKLAKFKKVGILLKERQILWQ